MEKHRRFLLFFSSLWLGVGFLGASDLKSQEVDFATDIQTVLARRCYACHGPDVQEGNLRFDVRESLLEEAESGETPVVPGNAEESEIIQRIAAEDESERMPPEGKPLSESEIQQFRAWIDSGAEYSQHWAFQPIQSPKIPDVLDRDWPAMPLDRFVLSRLEQAGLSPVPPASPQTLIRRLFMDVTGLPPSPETVARLQENWSEESYQRLVDQLLADSALGEQWARNWLDVVRFAETNSFERDGVKPNAWKYRDYVIHAMNDDKPYDQFIREQIAGDELDEVTDESMTATGYYRLGIWDDEPADPELAIFDGLDDLVTTTGQGVLGLTFNCARCHDHKIDPISQQDYYSLVAFLRDVTPYGTRRDQVSNNQIDLDPELAATHERLQQEQREIEQRTKKIEKNAIEQMSSTDQRATEGPERAKVLKDKLEKYVDEETFKKYSELQAQLADLVARQRNLPPRRTVLGLGQLDARPAETHILERGSPHAEGKKVAPAFPKLLGGGSPAIAEADTEARSAGRRRILADWLTSKDNWMTARVIVNRIWLHYFGRGITRSPNNFGLMGEAPTHPELIDHLATLLMESDWQLKNVHRAILLSSTYRLSTQTNSAAESQDPANNLFWRQNIRRLSAEQVRDSVLAVSGQINEQKYGPSMFPTLSAEVLASQSRPGNGWGDSPASDQARRSVYIHVKRSLPVPMLTAFDFPETDISCEARFLTTQPGQALTMLNGHWMQVQADKLYQRIQGEVGSDLESQARRCLELCLSRLAEPEDVRDLVRLVQRLTSQYDRTDDQARKAMCLVALNLNEFLYLD